MAFNLAGNVLLIGTGFSASVCTGAPGSGFYTLSTTLTLVAEGNFGDAVAINDIGDVAVIGAPDTNYGPGAAYVFRKTSGTWDAGTELVGTGKVGDASFGDAVAINGDGGDEQLGVDVGAVFVYKLAGGSYVENQGPILGNYYVDEPQIGRVVALSKDASTLVFSGYNDNNDDGSVSTRDEGCMTQHNFPCLTSLTILFHCCPHHKQVWIFGLGASAICPHLTIKTSTWSKKVRAGKDVKVTVRVVNKNKKNETEPLSVSLPLPAGVTYRGRTVLPKNRKLPAANTSVENGVVTWTTSPLARRKSRKFVATLQVDASLPSGSMSVFLATVTNGAVCFVDAAPRNVRASSISWA